MRIITTKNRFLYYILFLTFYSFNLAASNAIENFLKSKNLKTIFDDRSRNIYQLKSESFWPGYDCGMYVLHNARNMVEKALGINNHIDIKSVYQNYLNNKKNRKNIGLTNIDLTYMADNSLNLKNFYVIKLIDIRKIQLMFEKIHYTTTKSYKFKKISCDAQIKNREIFVKAEVPYKTDESKINQAFDEAVNSILEKRVLELKNIFNANSSAALHFVCELKQENHWVLSSVVKIPGQKQFLIFSDNLNLKYNLNQERSGFIDCIYNQFCI